MRSHAAVPIVAIVATRRSAQQHQSTRELGQLIRTKQSDIEQRWLHRVQTDVASQADVELTHLRNGIPDYLSSLAGILSGGGAGDTKAEGAAIWSDVAREHGITRVRLGFDIDELIHEFIVLRHEIGAVAAESGISMTSTEGVLADLIDAAIAESVRAYVDARDYELRRMQAENIGFLTHELRNPLAVAVQAAQLIRQQGTPEQARALDALDRSHRRLLELIDSVLEAERLVAGKVEPRIVEVREGDILELATEAARKVARDKGLAFEVLGEPARRIHVDPDLTRSAIENLVDNAVKYTDSGRVEVAAEETATTWSVHVRDSCHGLSNEELRTIFEPFRRGRTSQKGSGLGLSIARRAIEAQHGSLQAESPGPSGCHFWITLPRR